MRIRCTGCGREYRVSRERLTGESVRAKCRSCGTMLHIRVRRSDPIEPSEPLAVPVAGSGESDRAQPVASGGYRYCVACGGLLDSPAGSRGRPICADCESSKAGGRRGLGSGLASDLSVAGRRARWFFYAAIVLAVLVSAYLGYRLAAGSTATAVVNGAGVSDTTEDPSDRS